MIADEGTFKGHTTRERSLLFKYFDKFTVLFNAITQEFKTSYDTDPPVNGSIDIDRTFRERQCSFYTYSCKAIRSVREYACRHIYLRIFDTTPGASTRDLGYVIPPDKCSDINLSRKRREALKDYHSVEITTVGSVKKQGGCGVGGGSRFYGGEVYNSKTDKNLWESPWIKACSSEEAEEQLRSRCVFWSAYRIGHAQSCETKLRQYFERGMRARRNGMRRLAGSNCPSLDWCVKL